DITVQHTDGTTVSQLHKVTVQPNTTLEYIDEVGFIGASAFTLNTQPPFPAAANFVINSGMLVSQESGASAITGITALTRYTVDIFGLSGAGAVVVPPQQPPDPPPGHARSLQIPVTTADSSIAATDKCLVYTAVEGYRFLPMAFGFATAQPVSL